MPFKRKITEEMMDEYPELPIHKLAKKYGFSSETFRTALVRAGRIRQDAEIVARQKKNQIRDMFLDIPVLYQARVYRSIGKELELC